MAQLDDEFSWLRCPLCHCSLSYDAPTLACAECQRDWTVRNGLPDFTNSTRRAEEKELSDYSAALPDLVRAAENIGWCEALEAVLRPLPVVGPGLVSYVTNESKGDLSFLLDIKQHHRVLDLGCGLGAVSVALLQRGADCCAVDVSHEQAHFTAIRCQQTTGHKIRALCAGDDMRLPLPADSFDVVIMNGVLEWLGCANRFQGSPEAAQLAMLREIHRILRRGGQLYIASKNRTALIHLLGSRPDHGTKLSWIGMLPAGLQQALTMGRAADSRARIYSLHGYRRLFRQAGFRERRVYAVMPNFRQPKRFVPLAGRAKRSLCGKDTVGIYNRRLERLLATMLPGKLLKLAVYCYGFILEKV